MKLKTDCIYFQPDKPCRFHKNNTNILCENCLHYKLGEFTLPRYIKTAQKAKFQDKKFGVKILIIKLAALGDVLRTTSVLLPLYKKYKNPIIYWVTEEKAIPILGNIPYIEEVFPLNRDSAIYLSKQKINLLINLDLSPEALSLASFLKADRKLGYGLDKNGLPVCYNKGAENWFLLSHNDNLKKKNKKTYQKHISNICELKVKNPKDTPIIVNLTKEEINFAKKFAKKSKITEKDTIIGINTNGGKKWPKKEWPVKHTVELIKLLNDKNIKILIFGGKKEKERNRRILSSLNPKMLRHVIGTGTNNTLRQFFSLLNLCDLIITTDTLALHVVLGLKKKVIALFGQTSLNEIEMYGYGIKLSSEISCTVCYKRNCNKKPDCMDLITPKKVYKIVKQLSK